MKTHHPRSQDRILRLLKSLNRPLSAQEIFIELRKREQSTGLATIYRSLEALKLEGRLQVRQVANGESHYSLVQQDQHHLTCLNCGNSIAIDVCPVHSLETELQTTHDFKIFYHTLEFFGICVGCQDPEILDADLTKKPPTIAG